MLSALVDGFVARGAIRVDEATFLTLRGRRQSMSGTHYPWKPASHIQETVDLLWEVMEEHELTHFWVRVAHSITAQDGHEIVPQGGCVVFIEGIALEQTE